MDDAVPKNNGNDIVTTSTTTSTSGSTSSISSAISMFPDGVLIIDGKQTSCMVALVNEAYGFVSAACLMSAGETTAKTAGRLKLAINGLEASGLLSIAAAVVHPSYNATTLANNIGVLYFTANQSSKSNNGDSVAAAKCDVTKTYLERRTLSNLSPLTWNTPPTIVAFKSNSNDVCTIGSPIYSANKGDFICNNAVASPGSGLSSCALPLGLGYTAITANSALPSAVYSHSVVFGDGLCSNNKMVHYYVVLSNYLAWGAQVVQNLKTAGVSGKSANVAADYSMDPPAEIVPVIMTYSGDLYTQAPVPMATPTPSSGSRSYTTFYITTSSCDTDTGGGAGGNTGGNNPAPTATNTPPPPATGGGSDSSSNTGGNGGNVPSSDIGAGDSAGTVGDTYDTDCTETGMSGMDDNSMPDCDDSDDGGDNPFSGIANIVTMRQSGNGNVYVPIDNSAGPTPGNTGMNTIVSGDTDTGTPTAPSGDLDTETNHIASDDTGDVSEGSSETDASSDGQTDSAAESNEKSSSAPGANAATAITIDQLNKAIPDRVGDNSCATNVCATNPQALSSINKAIAKYEVTEKGEIAALIALMAYESGDWLYNYNVYPGRPGQGTRAMLMFNFIVEYAANLHPDSTKQILESGPMSDIIMDDVLRLVLNNDDSFGAAFWYLINKAPTYHNNPNKLRVGNLADFQDYVTNGVGATWDDSRKAAWDKTNAALNG
ncbi:hypothetical protein IW138_002365 [Coemansia sp. RSA 986]|nr:hypothetical protein IW138_002365 [Coemansia sp. RSA 986]